MNITGILFLLSGLLDTKPAPVFAEVSIGAQGPYRFLVDTGAESSLIDPALANELGIRPEFRVELVTQQSSRLVPGAKVSALRIGQRPLPNVELLFHDVAEVQRLDQSVRGILGLNALSSFDFVLSPGTGRLDDTASRPAGEVIPFRRLDGRIAVTARMGRERLTLALDSGSSHVVLFRTPEAMAKTKSISSNFTTIDGARSVVPTCWTAEMVFGDHLRIGTLPAAIVERKGSEIEGLLPASVFKKVFVDQARSELVLVR